MEKKRKNPETSKKSIEKAMLENFVNLQKVLTNLAVKFDSLSEQISKLLQLFEISAKTFVEKQTPEFGEKKTDKDFLEKLDKLLEQNKVLAKGLTLMEEKLRERLYGPRLEVKEAISGPIEFKRETEEGRPRYPRPQF